MKGMSILYYLMLTFGVFLIIAALTNWEWYFKQRRAQTMIKLMGRNGARWFYGLLGFIFTVFGYLVLNGNINVANF